MSERIEDIKVAVEHLHLCAATHVESVPIVETFGGKTVWDGVVEVFDIPHHNAKRCYAWRFHDGEQNQFVIILRLPPVKDPITAVRAYVASLGRK